MKMIGLSLSLALVLSGCAKLQIIDEIKIVQSLGYDMEGQAIKGFASYPLYKTTHRGSPLLLMKGQSATVQGITASFTAQSQFPIALGQTRTLVLSEDFAKHRISELIHSLLRDPVMGSNTTVVLTNQTSNKILTHSLKQPPYYFSNLIEQNMKEGNTPTTNLNILLNQYFGEGQDIFLPIVNIDPDGLLHMDGAGIFKREKFTLQINRQEAFFLKLLKDKNLTGQLELATGKNEHILMNLLNGKRNISLTNEKAVVSFVLHVQVKEYPATVNLLDNKEMSDLKSRVEDELQRKIVAVIEKFQSRNVDPAGFGELYRGKLKEWNEEDFYRDTYPKLNFIIHTEVIFSQSGVGS
ncbi:Ger(x)C family spore germination protein [Paenibacillus prosopidis]|uniref:Ger(X)C family germination protein n=1 Tax=Paenibacillus prosopidis TaxID=630520 RepID=A0A368W176_9BACL|nr:Ger(x)C family spore germination protein [Paenibacillus prosopidis]RCW48361.1 Ger(x)C family germination protein [Paenibacillus prosopidis]